MLTALRRPEPVTIEAFDNFVSAQADTTLFELVEGVIVMMTNPTETHEQITSNIGAPLKLAMDPRGCRTYQGGIRVQRSDDSRDTDKPRQDIVVRCGAVGSKTYITDPLVVVEVLSPSIARPSVRKCSGRKQARATPEMRCTMAAIHRALWRWAVVRCLMAAPRRLRP